MWQQAEQQAAQMTLQEHAGHRAKHAEVCPKYRRGPRRVASFASALLETHNSFVLLGAISGSCMPQFYGGLEPKSSVQPQVVVRMKIFPHPH